VFVAISAAKIVKKEEVEKKMPKKVKKMYPSYPFVAITSSP